MSETIVAYKGFDKDLKCRGFQYEVGKEYEEPDAKACEKGFHACEMPLDVLGYYEPGKQSRYCVVEQSGVISKHSDDTKVASSKIKIGAEIGIPGLVKAQIEYVKSRCTSSEVGKDNTALTGGSRSALTGGHGSALTGGYGSVLYGGDCAKLRGGMWSVLAFQVWIGSKIVGVKTAVVDGETIKSDTWYTLKNGEIVEATE